MPYTINDNTLPDYIKKLSEVTRKKWVTIFNAIYSKEGEKMAFVVANTWLKKELGANKKLVTIDMEKSSSQLIKKADGKIYVDFVLSDTGRDRDGHSLSPALLSTWSSELNNGLVIYGDTNHKQYDMLANSHLSGPEVIKILRERKTGIARIVSSSFANGVLRARALVDPGHRETVENCNGVSLEAWVDFDDRTKIGTSGELGGFTFAVGKGFKPVNPRAKIINFING